MSLARRLLRLETRGADYDISPEDVFGIGLDQLGRASVSGINVNDETALGIPTAYRCIHMLTDVVATQRCASFEPVGNVYQPAQRQPDFLKFPGPYTKIQTVGAMVASIATSGDSYTATHRDGSGFIVSMEPLDPERIDPFIFEGRKRYRVDGKELIDGQPITDMDILHIPGLLLPGSITGISPTRALMESIALTVAATQYGASFFGNGAVPGAVVEVEGDMSPVGKKALKREWNDMHRGSGNGKKLGVLTNNAKFNTISIPPNEAQFLQTRQFQVPEMARIYGVPPSLLGHAEGPEMGKTVEDHAHHFNQYSLGGWFGRISEGLTRLGVSEGGNPNAEIRFDREELERGNFTIFVQNGIQLVREGVWTINEFREKLGKPPVEWGDEPISVQVQEDVNDEGIGDDE